MVFHFHARGQFCASARDLAAIEIHVQELGAPLHQRARTRVRDLITASEIHVQELGAPLRQRAHARVRDLAAIEIHVQELGAPLRQRARQYK